MADIDPTPTAPEPLTPASREFLRFHRENEEVYKTLVELAREFVLATGKRRLGVSFLWDRARWDLQIQTGGSRDFRLNDHLRAYYARVIMFLEDDLHGVFELRKSDAENLMPHLRAAGSLENIDW